MEQHREADFSLPGPRSETWEQCVIWRRTCPGLSSAVHAPPHCQESFVSVLPPWTSAVRCHSFHSLCIHFGLNPRSPGSCPCPGSYPAGVCRLAVSFPSRTLPELVPRGILPQVFKFSKTLLEGDVFVFHSSSSLPSSHSYQPILNMLLNSSSKNTSYASF